MTQGYVNIAFTAAVRLQHEWLRGALAEWRRRIDVLRHRLGAAEVEATELRRLLAAGP